MADRDDTYYPTPTNEKGELHARSKYQPEPRHIEIGRRHIRNIRAQLSNPQPAA